MGKSATLALFMGVAGLVVAVVSRIWMEPIQGIEAHAFNEFSQTCFLLSIAASLLGPKDE